MDYSTYFPRSDCIILYNSRMLDGEWSGGYEMVRQERSCKESKETKPLSLICQMSFLCLAPSSLKMMYPKLKSPKNKPRGIC